MNAGARWRIRLLAALFVCLTWAPAASGADALATGAVPRLEPAADDLERWDGLPLRAIRVDFSPEAWGADAVEVPGLALGAPFDRGAAARAAEALLATGMFGKVQVEASAYADGVSLRFLVQPRRVARFVRVDDTPVAVSEALRATGVVEGAEVTPVVLAEARDAVVAAHALAGYPDATAELHVVPTDDPLLVQVRVAIAPGAPRRLQAVRFFLQPDPPLPELTEVLSGYRMSAGAIASELDMSAADERLVAQLRDLGWLDAAVTHAVVRTDDGWALAVTVQSGPRYQVRLEGYRAFDSVDLERALELSAESHDGAELEERVARFYRRHGYLDASARVTVLGAPSDRVNVILVAITEREPFRIRERRFACVDPELERALDREVDGVLGELLPADSPGGAPDADHTDVMLGSSASAGARARRYRGDRAATWDPEAWRAVETHLQEYLRGEGYLSAVVGPVRLVRQACEPGSPPGECRAVGWAAEPTTACAVDGAGLPLPEPPIAEEYTCVPDAVAGRTCASDGVAWVPVKVGPRATLYDVAFGGNDAFTEAELLEEAELPLGEPVSAPALDAARRRILERYAEEGYAFARVEYRLDVSPDGTRARAVFDVGEGQPVIVSRIDVRGADRTRERIIRKRIALEVGGRYRRSLVRKTEERIVTLGPFSNVVVALEEPHVPAREKAVIVTVTERRPQYLELRPGISTGEGFRAALIYGHRNLGGSAISLTMRVQLAYLPDFLIFDDEVRQTYQALGAERGLVARLERRNSVSLQFPGIGLGPTFRLGVDAIDLRDNSRDYGLTRDAAVVTLIYQPSRQVSGQVGATVELNTSDIFTPDEDLGTDITARYRVPEGTTVAIAQKIGGAWDRRDVPLGATKGTYLSAFVEHVRAIPVGDTTSDADGALAAVDARFLRLTGQVSGYVALGGRGTSVAMTLRLGGNVQLIDGSRTYPDRLFFLGGVDSHRAYLPESLVPQDLADFIQTPGSDFTVDNIDVRGGDLSVNPRLELRIPITGLVATALFLDAGNLWRDPASIQSIGDLLTFRYSLGTGIRFTTPVGPLVFDYGFNVERLLDAFGWRTGPERDWESIGAFHFSIGLF